MAAATGAPLGLNPRPKPNPSANCRSGGKPAALADITNTGRPGPPRHTMADVLKENAKLAQLVAQKTKIIELSGVEINKLRAALHSTHQQNLHLAQAHSQITAELNQAKDRVKVLQHELSCATAVLKVKTSGIERKSTTADNQLQTEITSQELKAAPSKFAPIEAHQADNKGTSANVHHSVETQSSVPFNTDQPEAPPDKTNKRTSVNTRTSKRKSESCEGIKETNTCQQSHILDVQPTGSLHHEDQRNTGRRRSSRLNPGSCEMAEASCEILHTDTAVPSSCSFSVPQLDEPNNGEDMRKAAQDELLCNTAVHIKASVLKKDEINKHIKKEANVQEEITHSVVHRIEDPEAHQIDSHATNTIPIHPAETQPSLPFNTQQPEPPKERAKKRGGHKRKLDSCGGQKDSNIEDTDCKLDSTCSEPPYHEETRKSPRRKSSRKNPGEFGEATKENLETKQEEIIAPVVPSSSDVVMEQSKDEKQSDSRSSMEPSEEQAAGRSLVQATGRRSSMRAAAKAVCYKEIPVNVKMRRP
ncbi:shugoshin-1 isoform X3 [Aegilops tauschii subsp. strangulata]|uniref:Shugoshin C-terminal domain-containing protein n=2 Tax=Aegilops tauschii subsp. strangulata TaxID=200361 RepID=A0A453PXE3_AEGTS|nr:shugoshin-1 isoform X3 [Aegilops tauschii subsp. strangulata]